MAENMKNNNEELVLDYSIKVNKRGEAILGVLEGPCADVINPTRNDRQYDEELWDRVFKDEIINEYFSCGGILGELDHPTDRTETDTSKVAICMPEKPKRGKDGKLYARFDILDTPNGRIAYTLAKYGYKLGVSSRGDGDVYEAYDGKEHVDPKTYSLKAFDLVILPAVKAARLSLKESVGNKTFKQALTESLKKATKDEKAIMIETLERLNIDYKTTTKKKQLSDNKESLVENVTQTKNNIVGDTQDWAMNELQSQIRKNKELTEAYMSAQEKLSVCYAKESKYEEMISKLQKSSVNDEEIKSLRNQIKNLTEEIEQKNKTILTQRSRLIKLTESVKSMGNNKTTLNEQLTLKDNESKQKDAQIKVLQERLSNEKTQKEKVTKTLNESIELLKKDKIIKAKEYSDKISKANKIVEHYKTVATNLLEHYIESKAKMFGVNPKDIKARLHEGYTFNDVDKVCESLQGYTVALNKLPMALQDSKNRVRVTESVETIVKNKFDDTIDESLLRLIDRL